MLRKIFFYIMLFLLILKYPLFSNELNIKVKEFQIQLNLGLGYFFSDSYMSNIRNDIKQKIIDDGYQVEEEETSADNIFIDFSIDFRYFYKNIGIGLFLGFSYMRGSSINYKKQEDDKAPVYMYIHTMWYPRLASIYYRLCVTEKYLVILGIGIGNYRFASWGAIHENDGSDDNGYSVEDVQNYRNDYYGIHGTIELYSGKPDQNSCVYGLRFYNIKIEEEWMPGLELYAGYNFNWGL